MAAPVGKTAPAIALIYTRVSSDEQADDGLSLPAQVAECRRYVVRNGWDFGDELQDVETGRRDQRAGYQRLLTAVRGIARTGAAVVVVASLDRLGRNVAERVRAYEELKQLGAPIHSVREGGLVSEFTYNILAAVAQEESRKLSERVRASNRYLIERGWHPVGRAPWGYRWRPATPDERREGAPVSVLELHPTEAPYVREAWERFTRGEAIQAIARWAAGLSSEARGGRNLPFAIIRMMPRAPVYIARPGHRTDPLDDVLTRPVGRWEPLISDAVWQEAHRRLALTARIRPQSSGVFLLTGLLRCDRCGSRMVGRHNRPRSGEGQQVYRQYICSSWNAGAQGGGVVCYTAVGAPKLEAAVLDTVREMLGHLTRPRGRDAIRRGWAERERQRTADDDARRLAQLERELATAQRRISAASVKFLDGEIDRAAYDTARHTTSCGPISRPMLPPPRPSVPGSSSGSVRQHRPPPMPCWRDSMGGCGRWPRRTGGRSGPCSENW
jgi:DNA invertase Pin-like site-specific DNA recombinase